MSQASCRRKHAGGISRKSGGGSIRQNTSLISGGHLEAVREVYRDIVLSLAFLLLFLWVCALDLSWDLVSVLVLAKQGGDVDANSS